MLNTWVKTALTIFIMATMVRCATNPSATEEGMSEANSTETDFLSDDTSASAATPPAEGGGDDLMGELDSEPSEDPTAVAEAPPAALTDESDPLFDEPTTEPVPMAKAPEDTALPAEEPPPLAEQPAPELPSQKNLVNLKSIQYRAGESGGTIVVDADQPMTYNIRNNKSTNQFIIEIPNSVLPPKLMRPLNTKDFMGNIGSIDAYQSPGSTTARVVIQLRPEAGDPSVHAEGNSLLILAQPGAETVKIAGGIGGSKIFSVDSLEEFLKGNANFTGKKISIETDDMELRDIFKLFSEEVGINLVIAEEVRGKMSLKLRQVPWDQALVLVLKTKKLGYTRSGNVLRIAMMTDIRQEEDDSVKIAAAMKATAPLKVRLMPISYANPTEIASQVRSFLSPRGNATPDNRTGSLILSDIEENLDRVAKLIRSIDVPPMQVLIEGKIVEASDQFERKFGINWNAGGESISMGAQSLSPSLSVSPTSGVPSGSFGFGFSFGTIDVLGSIQAAMALFEKEGVVKILSSPRIMTLHNERAKISQSVSIPVISPGAAVGGAAAVPTVTYLSLPLELSVLPQVTNDGAVIMAVDFNRSVATDPDATGNRTTNGRSASTKVLVKNGQTAVIGGIYQDDNAESETRVPGLGDLPVVGWLFKSKNRSSQKNELLIFLTPRILNSLEGKTLEARTGASE